MRLTHSPVPIYLHVPTYIITKNYSPAVPGTTQGTIGHTKDGNWGEQVPGSGCGGGEEEPLQQQSQWQPGHPDTCQLSKVGRKGSSLGWLPGMRSAGGPAWSQPVFSMRDQRHTQEVRFRKDLAPPPGATSLITSALSSAKLSSSSSPQLTPLLPVSPAATLPSQVYLYLPHSRISPSCQGPGLLQIPECPLPLPPLFHFQSTTPTFPCSVLYLQAADRSLKSISNAVPSSPVTPDLGHLGNHHLMLTCSTGLTLPPK